MNGKIVEFKSNGGKTTGYVSLPSSGKGKAVIVLQEWWGLVDHIKDVVDRFAKAGFVALAPDLYHEQTAKDPTDAQKLAMALRIDQVEKDLRGAVDYLLSLESTISSKVGIVGFCMGGGLSLYSACINEKIGACVMYYGYRQDIKNKIESLKAPVLGFFGGLDKGVSPDKVQELEEQFKSAKKEYKFKTYPDANHAFFNDTRPAYHAEAAKESWQLMLDFYNDRL